MLIERRPFLNSKKIYVPGKIFPDINVGMREIHIILRILFLY